MNNVFRNKNFCLVFLGALVSELGTIMYNFAVSFYISVGFTVTSFLLVANKNIEEF